MAAPSGIVWGDIEANYGKIGIYISIANKDDLKSYVTIQVWFASKYSVSDTNNTFYFDNEATSATTSYKDLNVKTTNDSGSGWSTDNEILLKTFTYTYDRTTSARTINCAAKLKGIDKVKVGSSTETMTVATSYSIPAIPIYTISYNANGGSGAPSAQTKTHGTDITLSSTKPTRSGYIFLGWDSSSTTTSATYTAGGKFTANRTVTLYAVWAANKFTVTYNANGGTGGPSSQSGTYGSSITLSSSKPTRTNYKFLGWATSANATAATYAAGATYSAGVSVTLYAVWESSYSAPRVTVTSCSRSKANGSIDDFGTYILLSFSWVMDYQPKSAVIKWKSRTSSTWSSSTIDLTIDDYTKNDEYSTVIGKGNIAPETTYDVELVVSDTSGSTTIKLTSPGVAYSIDFASGGKGAAFGKPAVYANALEIDWILRANKHANLIGGLTIPATDADGVDTVTNLYGKTAISNAVSITDSYGTKLTNGLAVYGSGGVQIDPDTTLDHLILTSTNSPMKSNAFAFIKTHFYYKKATDANRTQIAFPYKTNDSIYYRHYQSGAWSSWVEIPVASRFSSPDKVLWSGASGTSIENNTNTKLYEWTVEETGVYGMSATVKWPGNKNGIRALFIREANSASVAIGEGVDYAYSREYAGGSATLVYNVSGYARLTKNHVVRMCVWQDSGSALSIDWAKFQIVKIGL